MLNFRSVQLIHEERLDEAKKKQHYWQSRAGIHEQRLREAKKERLYWQSEPDAPSFGKRMLLPVGAFLIALGKWLKAYPAVPAWTTAPGKWLGVAGKQRDEAQVEKIAGRSAGSGNCCTPSEALSLLQNERRSSWMCEPERGLIGSNCKHV